MTWIVAKQFTPGYVALFSDIQITWSKGKVRKDCLKKVYPLSNNVIAGFSGSVDIGFHLLSDFNKYMAKIDNSGTNLIPRKIAIGWYRRARKIFNKSPKEHRKLGCSIIMAGVSPTSKVENTNIPRTDIIIFKHKNDFKPIFIPFLRTASIGSGNNVQEYLKFMNEMNDINNIATLIQCDGVMGGGGQQLGYMASNMMQQNPTPGISPYVHYTLVSEHGWQQFPIEYITHVGDDKKIEHKMPKVAESYSEYQKLQKSITLELGAGCA